MATIKEWAIVGVIIFLLVNTVRKRHRIKQIFEAIFSNVNIDIEAMKKDMKDSTIGKDSKPEQ